MAPIPLHPESQTPCRIGGGRSIEGSVPNRIQTSSAVSPQLPTMLSAGEVCAESIKTGSSTDQRTVQGPKLPSGPISPSCQSTRPDIGGHIRERVHVKLAASTNTPAPRSRHL